MSDEKDDDKEPEEETNENENENENENDNNNENNDVESKNNDDDDDGNDSDGSTGSVIRRQTIEVENGGHERQLSGYLQRKQESLTLEKNLLHQVLSTNNLGNEDPNEDDVDLRLNPYDEMHGIQKKKEAITEKWNTIIDPEDNGDVDQSEWIEGLKKLQVEMNEEEMKDLFDLIDGDNSGYVDRQDWIAFLTHKYQSEQLRQYQSRLLSKLNIKKHRRKNSFISDEDEDDWGDDEIADMAKEMRKEIQKHASNLQEIIKKEENFYNKIEEKKEKNPDFGKNEKAYDWSPEEVAWWLDQLELGQYAKKFVEDGVDGNVLLNDLNRHVLQIELGVNSLHLGKILREIDTLRKLHKDKLTSPYKDWVTLQQENESLTKDVEEFKEQVDKLTKENDQLKLELINTKELERNESFIGVPDQEKLLDEEEIDTTKKNTTDDDDKEPTSKLEIEQQEEILLLRDEIKHMIQDKLDTVIKMNEEMENLRYAVKVLSRDYNYLMKPKSINPLDHVAGWLGYKKDTPSGTRY